jgi:hypothetical protein
LIGTGDGMAATQSGGLWLVLRDAVGEIDRQHAESGEDAIKTAIIMLAHLKALKDGDVLRATKEPDQSPKLVEF